MESIDNYPGDIDGVQFPSSHMGMDDTFEGNCGNQA